MYASLPLAIATLAGAATASSLHERDPAANQADFTAAANALISSYIPAKDWPVLTASVGAAASSASVTGDVSSLIYSALEASPRPAWFQSAIPTQYAGNIQTLESAIDAIRPTAAATPGVAVPTVITTTTTNSAGSVVTTTLSTSVIPTVLTTTGTDSAGNPVTSTLTTK